MKRVKLFSGNLAYYIEKDIAKWQEENPTFEVLSANSSTSNKGIEDIVTTIVYDDGTLPSFSQIK